MARFENIVVAVDGSGQSEKMLLTLLNNPALARPKVTLLHVVERQITADQMHAQQERGKAILAESEAMMPDSSKIKLESLLVEGDAKTIVLDYAEKNQASLVLMGSRSRTRLTAILENSVSQYVFQLSSRPMLLVKEGIYIKPTLNRIMVAVDGSPSSELSLTIAQEFIRDNKSGQIFLVRVQNKSIPEAEDEVLGKAVSSLKRNGVPMRTYFTSGDPGREITRLAAESATDLLVMGSPERRPTVARGLPDLDRLLGASVSDYVRVHIDCPVLMVRSRQE